jgi:hypothetical protein
MPIDLIDTDIEAIATKLRRAEVNPAAVEVIVELHEKQRLLQGAVNELIQFYDKILPMLKLTSQLHHQNNAALRRLEQKFSDPNRDMVAAADAKDKE